MRTSERANGKESGLPGLKEIAEHYVTPETLDRELEGWLTEVRPYQWRRAPPLRRAEAALLVVDMTRPFVDEADRPLCSPNARAVAGRIGRVVEAFRCARRPVIWIAQGHHSVAHDRGRHLARWWPNPLLEGTRDVEMAAGLAPAKGEKVIIKRRYSGFHQTDLECTLRCLGAGQVAVCGVLTHVCPYLTAADAFMRDFTVYYVADGTASVNRRLHVAALQSVAGWFGYVVRAAEVVRRLGRKGGRARGGRSRA